ncbi:M6 family metalloprotease domain-containing protein [Thalassotalea profundi]|uniref:Peptidase M6 n=1 Tax=Thalassotalea profundi TaxID=2036687 RepID=A0ABQ3J2Q4_9GAMM|nr:M6 family metalloprotease domain-containing protein [Thalassotalea profundi]GHE97495.1 peptidase M6 [Thalassotalea profundi]
MKHTIISTLLLSAVSLSAFSSDLPNYSKSHADPGVINKEGILYWLEKRGELKPNASEAEKLQAFNQYLGKKSFEPKPLPGAFGRKMMTEQQTSFASYKLMDSPSTKMMSKARSQANALENEVTNVNVLALLIEFPDHEANKSIYTIEHYTKRLFDKIDVNNLNADITSASQYYYLESGGSFNFDGKVNDWPNATWLMADNNAAYYGGNDENDDDKAVPELIKEAVTKAVAAGLNLSDYDLDNDGIIDHVMVFHSATGEEAGGGSIGADAIWSHRYVSTEANGTPAIIEGSNIKLYGYTVTPVDARIGVIAHEFGHDLGYPDEYDTAGGFYGSPVGDWSIMASGSWVDGGSHPSGFSPFAKDFLQDKLGGNWINQHVIELDNLRLENIDLVAASNHEANNINQIKISLPKESTLYKPYTGTYQFYSSEGHGLNSTLSFNVDLPEGSSVLSMKSHWDIEQDWDYVLVTVNDTVIAGNHTKVNNSQYDEVKNFISGSSLSIDSAEGKLGWVDLTFDLSAYENQSVEIKVSYITDLYVGGYGFVVDDIKITNGENELFNNGAEVQEAISLAGGFFISEEWSKEGGARNYYAQLRNYQGTDTYLAGENYDTGVVLWYRDSNVSDNNVNTHPGQVFIGVVDGDQNPIKRYGSISNTGTQIRDAAFSLFDQTAFNGDSHLTAVSRFDDKLDYSSPFQPESGIQLPTLGLSMEVITMEENSNSATIEFAKNDADFIETIRNGREITLTLTSDNIDNDSSITWQLGDGTTLTGQEVTHTYASDGRFDISVAYMRASESVELTKTVTIAEKITGSITPQINGTTVVFSAELSGGLGDFVYRWDVGDGSDIVNGSEITHSYESFGQYIVTLSVVDETSVTQIITMDLDLQAEPLSSSISFTKTNLQVSFTGSSTGGEGSVSYLWDFGDGGTSSLQNPNHTYSSAGTYDVILKVTDDKGTEVESTTSVTVTAAPVVVPPVKTDTSSSGGGSLGIFSLMALLLGVRLKIRK